MTVPKYFYYRVHSAKKGTALEVEYVPGADVVEVVRCADCVHYHPTFCDVWSQFGTVQTSPDGYCYEAERREGESDERTD